MYIIVLKKSNALIRKKVLDMTDDFFASKDKKKGLPYYAEVYFGSYLLERVILIHILKVRLCSEHHNQQSLDTLSASIALAI